MVEYADRLSYDKRFELRDVIGTGELNWFTAVPRLSLEKKQEIGRIVFGANVTVKRPRVAKERNVATGYDIPIFHGEV